MGPALRPVLSFRGSCADRGGGAPPARGRDGTPVISAETNRRAPGHHGVRRLGPVAVDQARAANVRHHEGSQLLRPVAPFFEASKGTGSYVDDRGRSPCFV